MTSKREWPGGSRTETSGHYECGCPWVLIQIIIQGQHYSYSRSPCTHLDGESLDGRT